MCHRVGQLALLIWSVCFVIPVALAARPAPPVLCLGSDCGSTAPKDLGNIPARFRAVQFADPPRTDRSVRVDNTADLVHELGVDGSRIEVRAGTYQGVTIAGRDIDLVVSTSARFTGPVQVLGSRVRISGGTFAGPGYSIFALDTAAHLTIQGVTTSNGLHLYSWNGNAPHHISVMDSTIRSPGANYGILIGTGLAHIILARNDISNTDPEHAAVRIIGSDHVILADNRIFSSGNRIVRIHEQSHLHLWIRNQFETNGHNNLWIGPWQGVPTSARITAMEIIGNSYYGPAPGLTGFPLQLDGDRGGGIADVAIRDNRFFTPGTAVTAGRAEAPFVLSGNTFAAYRTPPPTDAGADH